MIANFACKICGQSSLQEVAGYSALKRVTSDAKSWPSGGQLTCCGHCGAVQKLPSVDWQAEIQDIYGSYEIYHQAGGAEQPIFDTGAGSYAPRSARIVAFLNDTLDLGEEGKLLDFGCGNGAALASFGAAKPGWKLFGAELSDRTLPELRKIPGFDTLYTCGPDEIADQFTLVNLIHSLEHVIDPVSTLASLRGCVSERGHIFVEVPDCKATPYDLLVADHLMHFSLNTLECAAKQAGYDTVALTNEVMTKELSWVGRVRVETGAPEDGVADHDPTADLTAVQSCVGWLSQQVAQASAIAGGGEQFGIFGSSISATWLQGSLDGGAEFFVDEDEARLDHQHMGRPIIAPADVPPGANVYVPLSPATARAVAARLGGGQVKYHEPPELTVAPS